MADIDDDGNIIVSAEPGDPSGTGNGNIEPSNGGNRTRTAADGTIIVEPGTIGGTAPDSGNGSTGKRGRGRPRGTGSRTRKTSGPAIDISGLENILLSAHAMLAGITKVAELEMEAEEAHKLAEAGAKVARHYDMGMTSKAMDWTNLIFVIGELYGSRFVAFRIRRQMEREQRSTQQPQTVDVTPRAQPSAPQARSNSTRTVNIPGVGEIEVPIQ